MKSNFNSIILQCYDFNQAIRHMTLRCLGNIIKFTPADAYELIVIDNEPKYPFRDGYKVIEDRVDHYVVNGEDRGCFASYNQGAELAQGDVLVFFQNDVFVHEGWLEGMRYYIDEMEADVVFPDQVPRTREHVEKMYGLEPDDPEAMRGGRDAGMVMMTRKEYDRCGGWDENIKTSIIGWKTLMDKLGGTHVDAGKVIITHIMAGNNLQKDQKQYDEEIKREADYMNR